VGKDEKQEKSREIQRQRLSVASSFLLQFLFLHPARRAVGKSSAREGRVRMNE
jgi:hypothetical protein